MSARRSPHPNPVTPRDARDWLSSPAGNALSSTLSRIANDVMTTTNTASSPRAAPIDYARAIASSLRTTTQSSGGVIRVSSCLLPRGANNCLMRVDVTTSFGSGSAAVCGEWPWADGGTTSSAALTEWTAAVSDALRGLDATALASADAATLAAVAGCRSIAAATTPASLQRAFRLSVSIAFARAGASALGVTLVQHLENAASDSAEIVRNGGVRRATPLSSPMSSPPTSSRSIRIAPVAASTRASRLALAFHVIAGGADANASAFPFRGLAIWLPPPYSSSSSNQDEMDTPVIIGTARAALSRAPHYATLVSGSVASLSVRSDTGAVIPSYQPTPVRWSEAGDLLRTAAKSLTDMAVKENAASSITTSTKQVVSLLWGVGAQHLYVPIEKLEAERAVIAAAAAAAEATAAAAQAAAAAAAPPGKGGKPPVKPAAPAAKAPPPAAAAAKGAKGAPALPPPPPPAKPDIRILWSTEPSALPLPVDAALDKDSAFYDFSVNRATEPAALVHIASATTSTTTTTTPVQPHPVPSSSSPADTTTAHIVTPSSEFGLSAPRFLEYVSVGAASVGPLISGVWDVTVGSDDSSHVMSRLQAASASVAARAYAEITDVETAAASVEAAKYAAELETFTKGPKGKAPAIKKGEAPPPPLNLRHLLLPVLLSPRHPNLHPLHVFSPHLPQ